jgi:hypothetical protein
MPNEQESSTYKMYYRIGTSGNKLVATFKQGAHLKNGLLIDDASMVGVCQTYAETWPLREVLMIRSDGKILYGGKEE